MSKRLDANQRKESILNAAVPLFARYGYDGTTTKKIASAAGVSEALLYRHFNGKRAIYIALKDHCCDHKDHVAEVIRAMPNNTATLVNTVYFKMCVIFLGREIGPEEHREHHEQLTRLMAHSCLEKGNFARAFMDEMRVEWTQKWRACLEEAHRAGDLSHYDPADEDMLWFGPHLSVTLLMFSLPKNPAFPFTKRNPELLDSAVQFSLRGMGLTPQAITTYYQPQSLMLFTQSMFQ